MGKSGGKCLVLHCFVRGMVLDNGVSQVLNIEVGVDFGGCEVFVSEQLLDNAQVGAILQQMGGKGVAECVRRDIFCDTCGCAEALDDSEDHGACELPAVTIEESDVGKLSFDIPLCSVCEPIAEPFVCYGGDGYESLLASLAFDEHVSFFAVDVR